MKLREVTEALKLQHTIFALPFAYLGLLIGTGGLPSFEIFAWVTLAMVGARTAGMAWNRLLDLPLDRANPRTASWPTAAGKVTPAQLILLALPATALFLCSAYRLNPLCLALSPVALAGLTLYPFLKRFTWACHFGLGLVLGMAPVGGWLAVTGQWDPRALWLLAAVTLWVAGFDILYATLDLDFDRKHQLYSVPQRFGIIPALRIARASHAGMVLMLAGFGLATQRAALYWLGWVIVAALLHYEHRLVSPSDLRKVNQAFFAVNGWVSIGLLITTGLDITYRCQLPFWR